MRSDIGLVANENIIVLTPRAVSCCYNICLLVDSGVIRSAQRPTLLSLDKSEQESWTGAYVRAHVCADEEGTRREARQIERSVTITMHRCPCLGSPMSKYIYCPPPHLPLLSSSFSYPLFNLVAVCQSSLLPFHTVITHLYICRSFEEPLKNKASYAIYSPTFLGVFT